MSGATPRVANCARPRWRHSASKAARLSPVGPGAGKTEGASDAQEAPVFIDEPPRPVQLISSHPQQKQRTRQRMAPSPPKRCCLTTRKWWAVTDSNRGPADYCKRRLGGVSLVLPHYRKSTTYGEAEPKPPGESFRIHAKPSAWRQQTTRPQGADEGFPPNSTGARAGDATSRYAFEPFTNAVAVESPLR